MRVMGLLRRGAYADSIALMQVGDELRRLPGIATAALLMATPANFATLAEADLLPPEAEGAASAGLRLIMRSSWGDWIASKSADFVPSSVLFPLRTRPV